MSNRKEMDAARDEAKRECKFPVDRKTSTGGVTLQRSSLTTQSGPIQVTTSAPQIDLVPPPPDERDTPMYSWMAMQEETLTVQDFELNGKEYQVVKNTNAKEPEPEMLPDKESQVEPRLEVELSLARLNSQLLDPSQEARRASSHQPKSEAASGNSKQASGKSQVQDKRQVKASQMPKNPPPPPQRFKTKSKSDKSVQKGGQRTPDKKKCSSAKSNNKTKK